jgi:CRP-like cAMP-binding protein
VNLIAFYLRVLTPFVQSYTQVVQYLSCVMSEPSTKPSNSLLDNLPSPLSTLLFDKGREMRMDFGQILGRAGEPTLAVYFPLTGFISQVAGMEYQKPLEVGMIGREGMLGAHLLLGIHTAPSNAIVQGDGLALEIPSKIFVGLLTQNHKLNTLLKHYLFVQFIQLTQGCLCQSFHSLSSRLAKWLLMSHDRARHENFYLTHQFIADMLGVRRSAVTIAAGQLQDKNIIQYSRGYINILNRVELEARACECYQLDLKHYKQQLNLSD